MAIKTILSFLTYAGKNKPDATDASGTLIPLDTGKLCQMLTSTYDKAELDCNIPISFIGEGGLQANDVRDQVIKVIKHPTVVSALPLAKRLQSATTGSSGMGLLFVCVGVESGQSKIVISRFPADEGIVAERTSSKLTVQFVEQVFLKSAYSYKAVIYRGKSFSNDFWSGAAVDKQVNHGAKNIADYWISDFLQSEFRTTGAAGTKRLAMALRKALTSTDNSEVKHDIASAVRLAANIKKTAMTIEEFCDDLHLSNASKAAVVEAVDPPRLLKEKFKFQYAEFSRHIAYKLIELDNGAILSAQVEKFDTCFKTEVSHSNSGAYTFTTSGEIINERLKAAK